MLKLGAWLIFAVVIYGQLSLLTPNANVWAGGVVGLALLAILFRQTVLPTVALYQTPMPIHPIDPLPDDTSFSPGADAWRRELGQQLVALGYRPALLFRAPDRLVGFSQVFLHESTGEVAAATYTEAALWLLPAEATIPPPSFFVTFATEFVDGGCLVVTNDDHPGIQPQQRGERGQRGYRFVGLTDVIALHAAHRSLVRADGRAIRPVADAAAWLRGNREDFYHRLMAAGYLRPGASPDHYRNTLRGALRAAWRLHPLLVPLSNRRARARADAALAAAS